MEKKTQAWPEIVLSSSDAGISQAISRAVKSGKLRKIAPRIYTSSLTEPAIAIIKRHRYYILSQLYPGAVISHRSALTGGFSSDDSIVMSFPYTKNISIPGMSIRLIKGPGPDEEDMPFLENLYIASQARAFLENVQMGRARIGQAKTLPIEEVETRLDKIIRIWGEEEIQKLRDQARRVASRLNMNVEFEYLDKVIGALLGTREVAQLKTEIGQSRARKLSFDPERIELFSTLAAHIMSVNRKNLPSTVQTPQAKINEAFFESYFSNFIEGTRFEITEAEKIIFENKIFPARPEDSHDILSTFRIVSDDTIMRSVPASAEQFLMLLRERHAMLMHARENVLPGKFKDIVNRAGGTVFVKPEEVPGTLIKGFELYQQLPEGVDRSFFMMFLISEVHPFIDGNGRIARIFMNCELEAHGCCRIIIPTVYREDYLLAIRKLSRTGDPAAYTKMLLHAQSFTHSISFDEYTRALIQLRASNAFMEPHEAKLAIESL